MSCPVELVCGTDCEDVTEVRDRAQREAEKRGSRLGMLAQKRGSGSGHMIGTGLLSQGLVNGFKWAPTFCVTARICLATGRANTGPGLAT